MLNIRRVIMLGLVLLMIFSSVGCTPVNKSANSQSTVVEDVSEFETPENSTSNYDSLKSDINKKVLREAMEKAKRKEAEQKNASELESPPSEAERESSANEEIENSEDDSFYSGEAPEYPRDMPYCWEIEAVGDINACIYKAENSQWKKVCEYIDGDVIESSDARVRCKPPKELMGLCISIEGVSAPKYNNRSSEDLDIHRVVLIAQKDTRLQMRIIEESTGSWPDGDMIQTPIYELKEGDTVTFDVIYTIHPASNPIYRMDLEGNEEILSMEYTKITYQTPPMVVGLN